MAPCWRSLTPSTSLSPASVICSDFSSSLGLYFITLLSLPSESLISPPRLFVCLFVPFKSKPSIPASKSLIPPSLLCFNGCPTIPIFLCFYLLYLCALKRSQLFVCTSYSLCRLTLFSPELLMSSHSCRHCFDGHHYKTTTTTKKSK